MSIKWRLILSFAATIITPILILAITMGISTRQSSVDSFVASINGALTQVDNAMSIMISDAKENVKMVATHLPTTQADDSIVSYLNTTEKSRKDPSQKGGLNSEIFAFYDHMLKSHADYDAVFMGTVDGGFVIAPIMDLPAGYDPRIRTWYKEPMASPGKVTISKAYLSVTGAPVVSICKVFNGPDGKPRGVAGIDLALNKLSDIVNNIKIGKTGYVMLIQQDGTILANPKDKALNFKKLGELESAGMKTLDATEQGKAELSLNDVEYLAYIYKSPSTNWKIIGLIQTEEVMTEFNHLMYLMALLGLALLIVFMVGAYFLSLSITKPVIRIVDSLRRGANEVASASGELSATSQSLAEGSSEQAASIEETSASLEEISSMTRQNADNAGQANSLTKQANEIVGMAKQSMDSLTESMQAVSQASDETFKIIKTIDEIAFQTNLLALNAAVEAARAGEAGAGFAVVADEVRNLAMRAAEAAKNTATLIEDNVTKIKEGTESVTETDQAFAQVTEVSGKVMGLVAEIAHASNEQAEGIEQVNKAIVSMDKVTQANAANAEEAAAASEEMSAQAETMHGVVKDLASMVDGKAEDSDSARIQPKAKVQHASQPGKSAAPPRLTHNAPKAAPPQDPKKVIPLDEDDFKDF